MYALKLDNYLGEQLSDNKVVLITDLNDETIEKSAKRLISRRNKLNYSVKQFRLEKRGKMRILRNLEVQGCYIPIKLLKIKL